MAADSTTTELQGIPLAHVLLWRAECAIEDGELTKHEN
jgi:hypothetical protein